MSRIAIIEGKRSPMCKAGKSLKSVSASYLGSHILKNLLSDFDIIPDEVIVGNVANPSDSMNIAKVITARSGLPNSVPAYTVHRNCASGMQAVSSAANQIQSGMSSCIIAGGVESMSNIPLLFNQKMTDFFAALSVTKKPLDKLKLLTTFRPNFLKPRIGLVEGLTDPISGLIMGLTAENIAKEFGISRDDQDEFALRSHTNAQKAWESGVFANEVVPITTSSSKSKTISEDDGIRKGMTKADLTKLKPYFDKLSGTVTVGNSSQITDGACFMILMSEKEAKAKGLTPIGYIKHFAYSGCDPEKMGLGPIFAIDKMLHRKKISLDDIDQFELNEAFSAQVLGCVEGINSKSYKEKHGLTVNGSIDMDKVNLNGGAVAMGHPVGMSGARIILHLAKQLKAGGKKNGIASLCIGGGQGGAVLIESE